jgi:DNA-binding response OmpR family regulator
MTMVTILLVCSDERLARRIAQAARHLEYRVVPMRGEVTAPDRASEERVDLVLIDWRPWQERRVETVLELRADARTNGVPVIAMAASAADRDVLRGWDAGIDFYLCLPFHDEELRASVRRVLGVT